MAIWATIDDVTNRWVGDDVPCDAAKIAALIDDAETVVTSEYPDLQTRIDDGLPVERVRLVIARMVTRVLRNPTGTRQRQETTGPFTSSMTYGGDNPGDLWLTDDERALLGGSPGSRQAFTITTGPVCIAGMWTGPDVWVPL